jgi:hypothetical protein
MSFPIGDFDGFIEGNRIKPESKGEFEKALSDLEIEVSGLSSSVKVLEINSSLIELQGKISEEGDEIKGLVNRVISLSNDHIVNHNYEYTQKRNEVLESIPDRVVSLEEINLDEIEGYLSVLLKKTDDGFEDQCLHSIQNYSLKGLCSNISGLSNEQLPESIEIVEKIIESLKNKSSVSKLISFCSETSSKAQSLFTIINYLLLNKFQNDHLEPFNKIFPHIPLDQAPITIKHLDLSKQNEFNAIPIEIKASIETLNLSHTYVTDFDLSGFTNLKDLNLTWVEGLTAKKFNAIPNESSVEHLNLTNVNVRGFDFSGFTHLKTLDLRYAKNLTADQFNAIPSEVKASVEHLNLNGIGITGFDFSGFTHLKTLGLWKAKNLTAEQFNAIPEDVKASIETLSLSDVDVIGFDFSGFTNLKALWLEGARGLIADQFNAISEDVKASIETLYLEDVDVTDFDFSGFTNLKALDLNNAKGLTAEQFNTIPNKDSIEEIDLTDVNVEGFDFSGFIG